jgi:iron complex outermembrane receptor protein
LYAYLRAGFIHDRLLLTGGVSRTWANVNDYSLNGVFAPGGISAGSPGPGSDSTFANSGVTSIKDTYIGGILIKALPNVSLYYNYSTNAELAGYTPLWEDGKQNEFGIKGDFFNNRLSISADHFETSISNLTFGNPLFNTGQSTIPFLYASLTNHGEELNVSGGITKNLSIIASYTNMKLRDFVGRRRRNIPDNMANILLDYRFDEGSLKNADVFVGVIHEGSVAGYNSTGFTSLGVPEQPGYYLAAYNVVNAGAGYKYGRYRFNLTVDNALNSQFWYSGQARTSISPYPGITFNFTMVVHI